MKSKTKNCETCYYWNSGLNNNYKCIPCKRGKYIHDNWKKKLTSIPQDVKK